MAENLELLRASKAWPVVEAVKLIERVEQRPPAKGFVLFETGYGPSGLPHIGTFAEVFRTSLVRQAFARLSNRPTRLYAFSDDMDGLRAVPDNIPDREMVQGHLHKPLTSIPDPFGTADSYGHNMNGRLRSFLDRFGFEYEFVSATECYRSGRFNAALRRVLERHEAIRRVVLPTLGPERRETYSPILPVSPTSGRVLQVPILATDPAAGTVTYRDPDSGRTIEQSVLDGQGKLQWRSDWAMRWAALEVDYEMYGKDLIDSAKLSGAICRILGGTPPAGFAYEMFLDEHGQKISKSKGNGLSCDEWLTYGTLESLQLFMFQAPRKAKRLYFDVIPRNVDDYFGLIERYREQSEEQRYHNPVWHIHGGAPPADGVPVSLAMLLNLASVANAEAPVVLWSFIHRYAPDATPANAPMLEQLVGHALAYYRDFVKPAKAYRLPGVGEKAALAELADFLEGYEISYEGAAALDAAAEAIQHEVYEIGKRHGWAEDLRGWFRALYEILLGQTEGPRFGSFVAFYGPAETAALVRQVLDGRRIDQPAA